MEKHLKLVHSTPMAKPLRGPRMKHNASYVEALEQRINDLCTLIEDQTETLVDKQRNIEVLEATNRELTTKNAELEQEGQEATERATELESEFDLFKEAVWERIDAATRLAHVVLGCDYIAESAQQCELRRAIENLEDFKAESK